MSKEYKTSLNLTAKIVTVFIGGVILFVLFYDYYRIKEGVHGLWLEMHLFIAVILIVAYPLIYLWSAKKYIVNDETLSIIRPIGPYNIDLSSVESIEKITKNKLHLS